MLIAACDTPTMPSADVTGEWDFTFTVFEQRSCPANDGLVRGCAGSGRLEFLGMTATINATHSYRASCQACDGAADYGVVEQPLRTARHVGSVLEFMLAACRFTTTLPAAFARTVVGTVVCRPSQLDGVDVPGIWTMSRR